MRERDDGRRCGAAGIAMIRCMSVPTADQYAAHAARLDRFLSEEPVVWLSTVRPDGAPHLVPIWFTWDGTSLLVFSKPGAQKVRNMRANPVAMLALGEPEDDFDVAMAEARVELVDEPATELPWAHLAKYSGRMAAMGLSPDQARQVTLDNCGISVVVCDGDVISVNTLNAAFHLQGVAA